MNSEGEWGWRWWFCLLSGFSFEQLEANRQDEIGRCIDLVRRDRIWSPSNHWERRSCSGYSVSSGERGQSNGAPPHMKFIFNLYELWIESCGKNAFKLPLWPVFNVLCVLCFYLSLHHILEQKLLFTFLTLRVQVWILSFQCIHIHTTVNTEA